MNVAISKKEKEAFQVKQNIELHSNRIHIEFCCLFFFSGVQNYKNRSFFSLITNQTLI